MELSHTRFGPFTLYTIETGRFRLDGGAMFGVVPKTLWSRRISADEKNRIPMAMRCLLIESENSGRRYLVDTGIGTKFSEKMEKIYAVDHEHSSLERSLEHHGFSPDDVTDVIFSHLHFDHCGGTVRYADDGESLELTLPAADFHVTRGQWETANNPNAREKASFFEENLRPLEESGRLNLVDENHEYEPGLTAIPVHGHTRSQQLPKISGEERTLVFMADLIPTHVHVPLPWVMGYDMRPAQTLEEKETFLEEAAEEEWLLYLEHDYSEELITVTRENGKYRMEQSLTLNDL